MARHRRHQQDPPRHLRAALDLEMDEVAERLLDQLLRTETTWSRPSAPTTE